jgi:hypothetical protein
MAKKPAIEVGDELHLRVDVVRVDEHELGDTVTFALETGQRFTIRQDSGNIVEVRKASNDRGR